LICRGVFSAAPLSDGGDYQLLDLAAHA
jgi:hypothetical protein